LILLLAVGAGLITSSLTVSYRDVQYVLPVLIQFLLYASPVGYAVPDKYRSIYSLNPLSPLLEAFRRSLLGPAGGELHWGYLACAAAECIAAFLLGVIAFKNMERKFADVI
ncbi:MAG TPA: ABC transporter permease, partial [Gemmataceae bacterium]|nr:ABC transporter permease [Gemmataceae bacterium]